LKTVRLTLVVALFALFAVQAASVLPAHAQSSNSCAPGAYYVASLNSNIDPGSADYLSSSVSAAEAACATHFVLVLATNGGDGGSMESMVSSIAGYQQWGGTFVTLVAPQGAYAFSAGAYIAEASSKLYMVPGTTIGSATPIVSGIPIGEENSTMTKDINAFASYMQTLAGSNGRNDAAAAAMVRHGVSYDCKSYTDCRAKTAGVIDDVLNATSLSGALAAIKVPADAPLNTAGIKSQFISIVSDPTVSSLLFLIGVFAVMFDIYHPTIVLTVVGVAFMALALLGLGIFGASLVSIVLMVAGAAFIFLEIKIQHGVSAIIGIVIFIVGFLLVFQSPAPASASGPPGIAQSAFAPTPLISYVFLGLVAVAGILGSFYLVKIRRQLAAQPSHFAPERMLGKEGKMESDVKPGGVGVANIASEEWTVISEKMIPKGAAVKVKEVKGNSLLVEVVEK
jgi:membrane-bound serine protease (ClpP class)